MSQGLLAATRYLTIVPVPGASRGGLESVGRAAPWFPVVGLFIGAVLLLVEGATAWLFPPLLASLLVVTAWKLLTGGLHLDGLADCLDGLVGHDPAHRLAIMRDSRIGAFGAIGLILFLLLEVAALAEIGRVERWRALVAAPVIGRAVPALLGRLFPPARSDGQGAAFRGALVSAAAPIGIAVAALVAVLALGAFGVVALAVALLAACGLAGFLVTRLGGITGDVLGAAVEIAELAVLLTVAAWVHARA
ncbi:MAG: adenosylcobinamide-GDP ribazoletransferase [Candidatus Rokubacteria bacterium]|nr:adenosylcobinamide-GDP ribazoletransferase [Candidatus Rokubacteria bacterium]